MLSSKIASRRVFIPSDGLDGGATAYMLEEASPRYAQAAADEARSEVTCLFRTSRGIVLRFFFGTGESDFCGHGILGATAWLNRFNATGDSEIDFVVGGRSVSTRFAGGEGERFAEFVSPIGTAERVNEKLRDRCLEALGLPPEAAGSLICVNAGNERIKTLIPLLRAESLDAIRTDAVTVASACALLKSTGLYPFAMTDESSIVSRQFPNDAGFLEDAATATAALGFAAARAAGFYASMQTARPIVIRQGLQMGRPSELHLRILDGHRASVGGRVD